MDFTVSNLITPAIILSVAAYIIRFYGKVISDQKPFSDDRDWDIELSGVMFFMIMFVPVASGFFSALKFGWLIPFAWIRITIIVLSSVWLSIIIDVLTEKIYKIKIPSIQNLVKSAKDSGIEIKNPGVIFWITNYYVIIWFFPFLYSYILTVEYQYQNIEQLFSAGILVFLNSFLIALFYSLRKNRPWRVDVIFINKRRSLFDVMLLKMNKDTVRIKKGDKVTIVNKDQVERIEIIPSKEGVKKD